MGDGRLDLEMGVERVIAVKWEQRATRCVL